MVPWSTWVAFDDDGGIGGLGGGILKYDGFVASLLVIAMRLCDELDEANDGMYWVGSPCVPHASQ